MVFCTLEYLPLRSKYLQQYFFRGRERRKLTSLKINKGGFDQTSQAKLQQSCMSAKSDIEQRVK